MKKILLILAIAIMVSCTEQPVNYGKVLNMPSVDQMVLQKINVYRKSLNLDILQWNDTIYLGAKHHTDYEYAINKETIRAAIEKKDIMAVANSGHEEDYVVAGVSNESFHTRADKYHFRGECVMLYSGHIPLSADKISTWIVNAWKESPEHNKLLIDPSYRYGAVSTNVVVMYEYTEKDKEFYLKYSGIIPTDIVYFSSTFNCR